MAHKNDRFSLNSVQICAGSCTAFSADRRLQLELCALGTREQLVPQGFVCLYVIVSTLSTSPVNGTSRFLCGMKARSFCSNCFGELCLIGGIRSQDSFEGKVLIMTTNPFRWGEASLALVQYGALWMQASGAFYAVLKLRAVVTIGREMVAATPGSTSLYET